MRNYGITSFAMDSGERYSLVVDKDSGLPEFHPNLFLTTQVRNTKSNSFSSISSAATCLVVLLRFLDRRGIDLEQRINSRTFFEVHELDDLRDFTQRRFLSSPVDDSVHTLCSQEELEEADKNLKETTEKLRETDIKAEQLERKVASLESEKEELEKKQEELTEKYNDVKAELDEISQQLEAI